MKKFLKAVVLTAVIVTMLTVSAFASDYDHCADALNELGLFLGSDVGYELDRAPTRAEASVMLVRLLGQEQAAKELTYSAPFTDVPAWAQPYVQYLYDNALTSGTSETTFGPGNLCTAQQYTTFLLRALGYSDKAGGDFRYADALEFGKSVGVVDNFNCDPDNFLRDNVVAMSYTALATAPKSGEPDLLTKLVNTGAIKDAKGYDKLFRDFRAYAEMTAQSNDTNSMSATADIKADVRTDGVDYMSLAMKLDFAMKLDKKNADRSKLAMNMDMKMAYSDEPVKDGFPDTAQAPSQMQMSVYFTDGYAYIDIGGQKVKQAYSMDEFYDMPTLEEGANQNFPICLIRSITATTFGGTATYHVVMANGPFNHLFIQLLGAAEDDAIDGTSSASITCDDLILDVTTRNGAVSNMKLNTVLHLTSDEETMDIDMDIDVRDVKMGPSVSVELPNNLNRYLDVTDMQR